MCTKETCKTEYAQIFHFIQSHRNGEVVDGMKARGIEYNMSYGLSITQINNFAKTLSKDNNLAKLLWQEPMRETQLFALHVFDPMNVAANELDSIVNKLYTTELVEQAVFVFLSKADIMAEQVAAWCASNNQLVALTGVMLVTRLSMTRKDLPNHYFGTFFATFAAAIGASSRPLQTEMAKALVAIARRSGEMKQQVSSWIAEQQERYPALCLQIANDELQYV